MMPENSTLKLSSLGRVWIENKPNEQLSKLLKLENNLPHIICDLISHKNIAPAEANHFLNPTLKYFMSDPFRLKDMDKGVGRIIQAIQNNEKITIYGDYDVDGATSTSLFIRYFRMLGLDVGYYIPDRQLEGYGPNTEAFQSLAADGTNLIITVDCGTLAFEPIAAARAVGVDVIVVDHHAGAEEHPDCVALINPNRLDETSELKHLAAVGVSFMVCVAVTGNLRAQGFFKAHPEPNLMGLLDIVALGTVCDVVSLTGLNRAFVSQGLKVMSQRQNPGISYLMNLLSIDSSSISPYHLGFVIGPRINAGGRIGTSTLGTILLSSDTPSDIKQAADELNILNEERRLLQEATLQEAELQVNTDEPIIVVCGEWHQGVIGIVAGRLKDRYQKPTFIISIDTTAQQGKASARSVSGFDIGKSIHLAHEHKVILQGGGHPMAGGFSLTIDQIDLFKQFMISHVNDVWPAETRMPTHCFDGHLTLSSITHDLIDWIEQLSPFGSGNPLPKFVFPKVIIRKQVLLQEKHLRCFLEDSISGKSMEAMLFNAFETSLGHFLSKHQHDHIDILGTVKKDTWNGRVTLKIFIDDARLST